jgi:hypothetical protein
MRYCIVGLNQRHSFTFELSEYAAIKFIGGGQDIIYEFSSGFFLDFK